MCDAHTVFADQVVIACFAVLLRSDRAQQIWFVQIEDTANDANELSIAILDRCSYHHDWLLGGFAQDWL